VEGEASPGGRTGVRKAGRLLPGMIKQIRKQFLVDVGDEPLNEGRGRHLRRGSK
jgi:hypothetical protein